MITKAYLNGLHNTHVSQGKDWTYIRLHYTYIVKKDGNTVSLYANGWYTATTARRFRQSLEFLGIDVIWVKRLAGEYHVNISGTVYSFNPSDTLIIEPDDIYIVPRKVR